jgi:type I site-specific restriction-modification system R (restriction) subunit
VLVSRVRLEAAIFIGFTATPLLRRDKRRTRDVFGKLVLGPRR